MGQQGTDPVVNIKVVADGSQAKQELAGVAQAASKITDDQRREAQVFEKMQNAPSVAEMARKFDANKRPVEELAGEFGELKRTGLEAAHAVHGLEMASEGGVRGFVGLARAAGPLLGIFRQVGAVLMGPIGLGLGAVAAGIAYLGKIADDNRQKIEKVFADSAKSSEELKKKTAEIQEVEKKTFEQYLADVRNLANAYDELISHVDEAAKRLQQTEKLQRELSNARIERDEQKALAGATTEEQRSKIRDQYAGRRTAAEDNAANQDLENLKLAGELQLRNANEQSGKMQGALDAARLEAVKKRQQADEATGTARAALDKYGAGAKTTVEAQHSAEVATAAAKSAEEGLAKVTSDVAAAMQRIDKEIDEARSKLEQAKVGAEVRETNLQTDALKTANANREKMANLSAESRAAMDKGDYTGQDKANAELVKVGNAIQQATNRAQANSAELDKVFADHAAAQDTRDQVIIKNVRNATKQAGTASRQILNSRE